MSGAPDFESTYTRIGLLSFSPCGGDGPLLASPLDHVGQQVGGFPPRGNPFRTYPKRVCSCHFQSQELRKHSWVGLLSSAQRRLEKLSFLGLVNLGLVSFRIQAPSFREGWLTMTLPFKNVQAAWQETSAIVSAPSASIENLM